MPDMWLDQDHQDRHAPTISQERNTMSHISTIPEILADIKAGKWSSSLMPKTEKTKATC